MHPEATKLLLIEDNPADARLIEIMLAEVETQEFTISTVQTFAECLEKLKEETYDVMLLDLSLPDSFGIQTVQNANKAAPDVPIIVLTGRNDEEFALEVVKAGAQDYLIKGKIDSSLLSRSIRYAMKRKEMEVDLRTFHTKIKESESRLNVIVSNNISGIVVIDRNNQIKFVNPAAEKILAMKSEDLVGSKFEYEYSLEGACLANIQKTGSFVEVLAVETEWGGDPSSILITLHDITELKAAEDSLRIKNLELTRINKALDRFVYIITHDLKKPTANILGLLTLYEKELTGNESPKSKMIFEKLSYSSMQLKKMIEDLLESTKREKHAERNFELIDMKKLFQEVESSMGHLIEEANAKVTTDFVRYPLIFYSYQDMKSIVANLLSNAIKYRSPEREPEVLIKTEKIDSHPQLTVMDNGIGIDLENNSDKLFQKYQRFSNQAEGTGLGLWIINEIVEKNGGQIEIESEVGRGTTFKILF